ncbi:helix-turn-helix domain-containing protein [Thalassotalea euphylliae]|uniref:helix-turn-helix domain-containing protein n=1 Tax=Thalassotalea euphylliae TaxID=1655234 RepID=UPI00363A179A
MIVKKLREKKYWSQEQLANMAGLSLRTIQRVEAGNPASQETLKSLASVFEIDVSKLTERLKMIDKKSEDWQSVPLWVSFGLLGFKERKPAILSVVLLLFCGAAFYLNGGWGDTAALSAVTWLSLYLIATGWFAAAVHWVDKKRMW